jgi:hypothetical protein
VAKVFYNDFGLPPATLYLVLVGKPRTGKGAIMRAVKSTAVTLGLNVVGDATPEALAEELESYPNTVQVWEDVGSIVSKRQLRDRYIGLDKLLNNMYYLSFIEHRRKQAKTVILNERSYLFSFIWDTTPEEWGAVEEILGGPTGFARRVLPVRMSDVELPYFKFWRPNPEAARHLAALKKIAELLRDKCFMVDLEVLKESDLEERMKGLDLDPNGRSRVSDYVKKLTALALVDRVIGCYWKSGVCEVSLRSESLQQFSTSITLLTFQHPITSYNIYNIPSRDVINTAITCYNIITRRPLTTLAEEDLQRYAEATRELFSRRPVVSKREWWLKVLKGRRKSYVDEVLRTFVGLGIIIVRYVGRSCYLVDPHARVCGSCRHWGTAMCKYDPKREGLVDLAQAEWAQDKCYEPAVGGE